MMKDRNIDELKKSKEGEEKEEASKEAERIRNEQEKEDALKEAERVRLEKASKKAELAVIDRNAETAAEFHARLDAINALDEAIMNLEVEWWKLSMTNQQMLKKVKRNGKYCLKKTVERVLWVYWARF